MNDEVQRALPRDAPNFHQRQASHLRALAATTTAKVKGRLLAKAAEHDSLAESTGELD